MWRFIDEMISKLLERGDHLIDLLYKFFCCIGVALVESYLVLTICNLYENTWRNTIVRVFNISIIANNTSR